MEIKGVTRDQLATAIERADPGTPGVQPRNVHFRRHDALNQAGTRWGITLTVWDSRGRFARRGHTGRRIAAACWHAYRNFLVALFDEAPEATVKTMLATYRGRAGFFAEYPRTGLKNWGSIASPLYAADACECGSEVQ